MSPASATIWRRRCPTSSDRWRSSTFVNALLIVEQRQRLRLAWERLLTGSAA
jgi:hypothetical protein